jgi:putative transposase
MTYPLVRELADDGIPVTVTCRVLGFSTQGYYRWRKSPCCDRDYDDAYLTNAALDAHTDDPEFGYRFIADELRANGHVASERRVWKVCSRQGIWSTTVRRRKGRIKVAGPPVHDDLVERDFTATRPDELWLTDITEHWTGEGKLYCCCIKDVYSNRIVGYATGPRMKASLATRALRNAIALRRPVATVVHSDRGSQFRARSYVRILKNNGLQGSMGRVGAAGDNAAMESFFALLQKNVLDRHRWETREQLHFAIVTWIERTYHRRRRQRTLGCLTPIEVELLEMSQQAA